MKQRQVRTLDPDLIDAALIAIVKTALSELARLKYSTEEDQKQYLVDFRDHINRVIEDGIWARFDEDEAKDAIDEVQRYVDRIIPIPPDAGR